MNRARSSDPAARKNTDLSDPFAHHPAQDRELHLRVLAWMTVCVCKCLADMADLRQVR